MSGQWRHGLCEGICGSDSFGGCLASCYCGPCAYGRVSNRLSHFPDLNKENYDNVACNGPCWIFTFAGCFGVHCIPILMKRGEMREKFNLEGNACTDCMLGWCCVPCAIGQMNTELKDRAASNGPMGGMGGDIKQGQYAAPQGGMAYQPA